MSNTSIIDAQIQQGWYGDCCDQCRTLNPPSLWQWYNADQDGISTIHSCACGYTHRVAWWSTRDDL